MDKLILEDFEEGSLEPDKNEGVGEGIWIESQTNTGESTKFWMSKDEMDGYLNEVEDDVPSNVIIPDFCDDCDASSYECGCYKGYKGYR